MTHLHKILGAALLVLVFAAAGSAQTVPPVLQPIGAQSVDEGQNLSFTVTATDGDATTPILRATTPLPANMSFTDNLDGTGSFSFDPDFTQAGVFNIRFYADDAVTAETDSIDVAITVNDINQVPVWTPQNDTTIAENQALSLVVSASDPDGGIPALSATGLPAGATFDDNLDGTGTLTWTPTFAQSGAFPITFNADDGTDVTPLNVTVTVTNVNQAPTWTPQNDTTIAENQALSLLVTASDLDGGILTLSATGLPTGANFTDNGNNTGTLTWTPTFAQSGAFPITFNADDGTDVTPLNVTVNVTNVNQVPTWTAQNDTTIAENQALSLIVTASDLDGGILTLSATGLPAGANFTDNGDNTGTLTWTPTFAQSGAFPITFNADDGTDVTPLNVTVTVTNVNQVPTWTPQNDTTIAENQALSLLVTASDLDGGILTLSATGLPIGANFTDNGDNTGTLTWTPTFAQSGAFPITFNADDGTDVTPLNVTVTVTNVNQVPTWTPQNDTTIAENQALSLIVTASDLDGGILTLSATGLPTGANFTDNGNNTGTLTWTPTFDQSGTFPITFNADDGTDVTPLNVTVTVTNVNQVPTWTPQNDTTIAENQALSLTVTAADLDGGILTLTATGLPTGANFTDNGDNTGTLIWTPAFDQSGAFPITFNADDGTDVTPLNVTVTVTNVNQVPTWTPQNDTTIAENQALSLTVTASDLDGGILTLSATGLPTGANFTDNGNNTGTLTWTPTFAQSGSYAITFNADDGTDVTPLNVTVTVTNVNQAPTWTPQNDTTIAENQALSLLVTASDLDGGILTLSATGLPAGANFTDNGNNTGTLTWTPTFAQSGSYAITFNADDGTDVTPLNVTINVGEVNLAPVLAAIGDQEIDEGQTLAFVVNATDPDGNLASITTSALPTNASFVDNGDGTGNFSFTPDFTQAGTFDVTFTATDDSSATDAETITITVNQVNVAPVLAAIGAREVDEGQTLSFGVSATDADGNLASLSASPLPANASFVDNGNGTGTFSFTPDFTQSGTFNITFTATDDSTATDNEIVVVTVNQINLAPVLDPIGPRSTTEGVTLAFTVTASDPDANLASLTAAPLPPNASFVDNGDGTGSFSFTPDFSQAGIYNVTFTATDDSSATDAEIVTVTVNDAGNQPPVLDPIGPQNVNEGATLNFAVSASDPDGTIQSLTASNLPANASFVDNGDGTGSLTFNPDFTQQGVYNVTITATDNLFGTDVELVPFTVNQINLAPVLDPIGPQTIAEGNLLTVSVTASDPDGNLASITASPIPANASFVDNGNGTGTFSFTPDFTQAGTFDVTFTATDDSSVTDAELVTITVTDAGNQPPVLAAIGPQNVDEGATLNFSVSATDIDGTVQSLAATNLPLNASFVDNGDGTGNFSFTPDFTQQGVYNVTFTATDNGLATDEEIVAITVNQINLAPVLDPIGPQSIAEGATLTVNVTASDPDGNLASITAAPLPTNASFVDNGNGTGTLTFTPDFTQSGSYDVTFTATDDSSVTDAELVTITVTEGGNQPPVLAAIGPQNVDEGATLNFTVTASDIDGTVTTMAATNLPTGASFVDNGDGTGDFSFTPDFTQQGVYNVTFTATDDGLATDDEIVAITVNQINLPPVLDPIGPQSTTEGSTLTVNITSSDPDGTFPALTAAPLPTNASLVDNGDGTGTFTFTPSFTQSGIYNITFTATDDSSATDAEIVAVTVTEVGNQSPVLAPIGPQEVDENATLAFSVSATDADGTIQSLTATNLPANATFIDNGDGTGNFSFTPDFTQQGTYNVTFTATDNLFGTDVEVVAITVNQINLAPVLDPIGPQSIAEGATLTVNVTASDPDGNLASITAAPIPTNGSFVDNGDGTATLTFTPDFTQSGTYDVTFTATDDSSVTDAELVTITVTEGGNQPPVIATVGPQTVDEGATLQFTVTASDVDGTVTTMTATNLPANATYVDNGDGTGDFSFTPDFTQAGVINVTFTATDNGLATDDEIVAITVNQINLPPVLDPIGPQSIAEGATLTINVTSSDPDANIASLTAAPLPTNASFVDNGDGTGTFTFTPDFTQSGLYNVTFTVTDDSTASDFEAVAITVTEGGNQPPVVAAVGPQNVDEGATLNFTVTASDIDGTVTTMAATNLPLNATFVDNGDGTGDFSFTPDFTQQGTYNVTFTATDDGLATDDEIVAITVNQINLAPVLDPIGPQSIAEGGTLTVNITSSDPDGTFPALTAAPLPANASLVDNGDGTGTFTFTPNFTQSGIYNITFTATDDSSATDQEIVAVTVTEVGNQPPVLAPIGPQSVDENVTLAFSISATDADGTIQSLAATNLPTGATFIDNGDGTGDFSFTPDFTQAGTYNVTFTATDNLFGTDVEVVAITVNNVNRVPTFNAQADTSLVEGETLVLTVSATDPDLGTVLAMTAENLPANASFNDNQNNSGTMAFSPDFTQAGSYPVTYIASDGEFADTLIVTVTVTEAGNQAPIVTPLGDTIIVETQALALTMNATDPDGEIPTLEAYLFGQVGILPANASFTDNGDGSGSFAFTPDVDQSGVYTIVFKASDAALLNDSDLVQITVNETNQVPVIAAVNDTSVIEGDSLSLTISATDGDGSTPALLATGLPANASFIDNLDGTGTFDFNPDFTQAGPYVVTFIATDGFDADSLPVTVTVIDAGNQPPVLDTIPDTLVTEGDSLTIAITSSDPDGPPPTLTAQNLPTNATFTDNGDGTGTFNFNPDFVQAGTYNILIIADDGEFQDTTTVVITVQDVGNLPPTIAGAADTTIGEGGTLVLNIVATDPDGAPGAIPSLTISTGINPTFYTFVNNFDGTATFTYNPNYFAAGVRSVTFFATDNGTPQATGQETAIITVNEVNQPPALNVGGPYGVVLGDTITVTVVATDSTDPISSNTIGLSGVSLPPTATFTDNGDNTGTLRYAPLPTDIGLQSFQILAVDRGTPALSTTGTVNINVVDANDPPILDPIGPQIVTEGQTLNVIISATDPDGGGIDPSLYVQTDKLPANAAFTDLGTGNGAFSFTPDFTQSGDGPSALYSVTFYASDGIDIDKEVVLIQVNEAGDQDPAFDSIPSPTFTEGDTLSFSLTAYDPDGGTVTLDVDPATLPAGATFTDNGDGSATIEWNPDFTTAGTYNIDIIATDGGGLTDTITVALTIQDAGNQLPVLNPIADQATTELRALQFTVTASDPDGDFPVLSANPLPGAASFSDNGAGTGTFSWTPTDTDSGTYAIMFYATDAIDAQLIDSQAISLVVADTNRVPRQILPFIENATINEGQVFVDTIFGADPDGTTPTFTARLSGTDTLATNMTFTDLGNGSAEFRFTPDYTQGNSASNFRTYNVDFLIVDEINPALFTVVPSIQYRVNNANQPPELVFPDGAGPFTMTEGDTLSITVAAVDGDGGSVLPTISTGPLPPNATYLVLAPNAGRLRFNPSFSQAGVYSILLRAVDTQGGLDTQSVVITVNEAGNQAPNFTTTLPDTINLPADNLSQITVTANDPDADLLTMTATPIDPTLPGATFAQNGNNGTWSYQPTLGDVGSSYSLFFEVSDPSGLTDTLVTTLRVVNFLRGDVDGNKYYTINDLAVLVDYLFRAGPQPPEMDAADVDGTGSVNLADVSYLVSFMYRHGPPPPQ